MCLAYHTHNLVRERKKMKFRCCMFSWVFEGGGSSCAEEFEILFAFGGGNGDGVRA
jgi:hypothetical protein